jgi:hypothetical protein
MFVFERQEKLLRRGPHLLKYSERYANETPQQTPYLTQDFSTNVGHNVFIHLGESDIKAQKPRATFTHCYVTNKAFSPGRAKQFHSVRNMVNRRRGNVLVLDFCLMLCHVSSSTKGGNDGPQTGTVSLLSRRSSGEAGQDGDRKTALSVSEL